eukprot:TRINITY_DN7952_c0_g1_i3.p1 TRINITY_DN7952_c0_g1~~TRINITY_DN7952_c0_g1_i3.p1  ORF type:complete len:278 (+),score=64.03 TRINITY_DN7952_c0_g1_i3:681-1514(+)
MKDQERACDESLSSLDSADQMEKYILELKETVAEEERLISDLTEECTLCENETSSIDEEIKRNLEQLNNIQFDIDVLCKQRDAIRSKIDYSNEELERSDQPNPWNDVFKIKKINSIGSINGLRLGRLPNVKVEWDEINAAFGECMRLLDTVAKLTDFEFTRYTLHPCGSTSSISEKSNPINTSTLYYSDESAFSRLFKSSTIDRAIVWFLDCLHEISIHATKTDPSFELGARIDGGTIKGISAILSDNQDRIWTQAMLYMLSNLQRLLTWLIRQMHK